MKRLLLVAMLLLPFTGCSCALKWNGKGECLCGCVPACNCTDMQKCHAGCKCAKTKAIPDDLP